MDDGDTMVLFTNQLIDLGTIAFLVRSYLQLVTNYLSETSDALTSTVNIKNRNAVYRNHSLVASRRCALKSAIAGVRFGRNYQILGRNTQDKQTTTLSVSTLVIAWIVWRETR